MGASGGINWVTSADPHALRELLRPLGLGYGQNGAEHHDCAHTEFMTARDWPAGTVFGSFGTDHGVQGMEDLISIMDELGRPDALRKLRAEGWTWRDMLEDHITAAHDEYRTLWPRTRSVVATRYAWRSDDDDPWLDSLVSSWVVMVLELVDTGSFGSVETWT